MLAVRRACWVLTLLFARKAFPLLAYECDPDLQACHSDLTDVEAQMIKASRRARAFIQSKTEQGGLAVGVYESSDDDAGVDTVRPGTRSARRGASSVQGSSKKRSIQPGVSTVAVQQSVRTFTPKTGVLAARKGAKVTHQRTTMAFKGSKEAWQAEVEKLGQRKPN
eukprot:TRINITY_DN64223_c0_g1_i1.p1 TRINITY_DN64223_c0_g1~~TRINITY_DN64223_c0_g1_i1.p1  ORF type:complete len:189 (-),score=22.50 TRINITY_DN64223_c0_g1_i1:163-660(-)